MLESRRLERGDLSGRAGTEFTPCSFDSASRSSVLRVLKVHKVFIKIASFSGVLGA
jgi:hypothetical protein